MSQAGIIDFASNAPSVPTSFVTNSGTAVPIANVLDILGAHVAASASPVATTGATNVVTINVQATSAQASSSATNMGLASFNSADFTVDANGYVSTKGTTMLTVTKLTHANTPYTVLATDDFLAITGSVGTFTVLLPNAPATGTVYYIKDSNGAAASDNIAVTTVGGAVNIDGATTYTMATNYQAISVIFTGSQYEVF